MSLISWLVAAIASLYSGMADRLDVAQDVVEAAYACYEREGHDPLMVLAIIGQESSFQADPCQHRTRLENITGREPVEGHEDRERVSWDCYAGTCSREVWEVSERDGYLYFNTCPAGEVGHMQVLRSSQYARAGYPIPGTETVLVDASDGEQTAFALWPGATQETVAVLVDGEQIRRSQFTVTPLDGGAASLSLRNPPEVGARVVAAEALSTINRDRRAQLVDARINIALGCAELSDHREGAPERLQADWWDWVGSYNTGSATSETGKRYARRIVKRYREFCEVTVTTDDGESLISDLWSGCGDLPDE
jgi:hypothetical protein